MQVSPRCTLPKYALHAPSNNVQWFSLKCVRALHHSGNRGYILVWLKTCANTTKHALTFPEHIWGECSEVMLAHDIVGKKEDIKRYYNVNLL